MRHALLFFGVPSVIMLIFSLVDIEYDVFNIVTTSLLFLGLIIIGAGYYKRNNFISFLGWYLFALYWATQPEFLYYKGDGDIVNAVFCIVGVYFLAYISYHEYLCYKRNEKIKSLRFLAGATFFSGILYFTFQKTFIGDFLIKTVADQTVFFLQIMGYNAHAGTIVPAINPYVPIYFNENQSVQIILACTGLQSMAVFIGVFIAINADFKRKIKAFLYTIPTIYILNLVRNVGVVYGMEVLGLSFYTMHNVIGKFGSLIVLIALAFIVFNLIPELYENIMDLFNLPKRKGPIERMFIKFLRK